MNRLTKNEEIELLNDCLKHIDFLGNGSSRATYRGRYQGHNVVVKVFIDFGGFYQSIKNEIPAFEEYGDRYLGRIYAYGHNCLVCEELDEVDGYMAEQVYESSMSKSFNPEELCSVFNTSLEDIYDMIEVFNVLEEINGETGDNVQIGYSAEDNRYKAYDYGYDAATVRSNQVGEMNSYIDYVGEEGVLKYAIEMVENDMRFENRIEKLMDYSDSDYDYWNEDDEDDEEEYDSGDSGDNMCVIDRRESKISNEDCSELTVSDYERIADSYEELIK